MICKRRFFIICLILAVLVFSASSVVSQRATPVPDTDGDGLNDTIDQCPDKPGPRENNGCPYDRDGDGVPDDQDRCPDTPGPADNNGCPREAPDSDGDGLPDSMDVCPNDFGPQDNAGCPLPSDGDEDGIPDDQDSCPSLVGLPGTNGCPLPVMPTTGPCLVTTAADLSINVRDAPWTEYSTVVGQLDPLSMYPVDGQFGTEQGTWHHVEGQGWVAGWVTRLGGRCASPPPEDCPTLEAFAMSLASPFSTTGLFNTVCPTEEELATFDQMIRPLLEFPTTQPMDEEMDCGDGHSLPGYLVVVFTGSPYTGPFDQQIAGNNYYGHMCPEVIYGNDADNVINGAFGDDIILGFGGSDTLDGGPGNDVLLGFDGDDTLLAGPGEYQYLYGMGGDDNLVGGSQGSNVLVGDEYVDEVFMSMPAAVKNGVDFAGVDLTTPVTGNDMLVGGEVLDIMFGGAGSDILLGNGGDDWMIGGYTPNENDYLDGGSGDDLCSLVSGSVINDC